MICGKKQSDRRFTVIWVYHSKCLYNIQLFIQFSFSFHTIFRGCLVPLLFQKKLGFGSSFCKMKLNTMQIFWQKSSYFPFWILASRGQKKKPKRASRGPHEGNKFCILVLLAFCIPSFQSSWHFAFFWN